MSLTREVHNLKGRDAELSGPSPLVGRDRDLLTLRENSRPAIIILGEPGIGKTRLLREAGRASGIPSTRLFYWACPPAAAALSYDSVFSVARLMHQHKSLSAEKLQAVLHAREADRAWYLRDAIEAVVIDGPLLIQVDDVQWADAASLDVLRYLIERFQDSQIRWHLASRAGHATVTEFASALERLGLSLVRDVECLTLGEMSEWARIVAPRLAEDKSALRQLHEKTGGNPLYLEFALSGRQSGGPHAAIDIHRIFQQRLAPLSTGSSTIAGWLAVSEEPLREATVATLAGFSLPAVKSAALELIEAGILVTSDDGLVFKHGLLRDACYKALDDAERSKMHAALASRVTDAWRRASHFDGAGEFHKAASTYLNLGWQSLEQSAPRAAQHAFRSVIDRSSHDDERTWEARAGLGVASLELGCHQDAHELMSAVEAEASVRPARTRAVARGRYAEAVWETSQDHLVAQPLVETAIADAQHSAPELLPRLYCVLGAIHERAGELEKAKQALERGIASCNAVVQVRESIRLRAWLGIVLGRRGNPKAGLAEAEAAAMRAHAFGLGNELAYCCTKVCYLCDMIGDLDGFERWCRRGLEARGPISNTLRSVLLSSLGAAAVDKGHLREALALYASADQAAGDHNDAYRCAALCAQARIFAMLGDCQSADAAIAVLSALQLKDTQRRWVAFISGAVNEHRRDFALCITDYLRALPKSPHELSDVFELRSIAGIGRASCEINQVQQARDSLADLESHAQRGWGVASTLAHEVRGHLAKAEGDIETACSELEAARSNQEPFRRTLLQLTIADLCGDRNMLSQVIDEFETMGSTHMADRARAAARRHGMRPGRMRRSRGDLTDREAAVASLVAAGKTNGEIARTLYISVRSAEFHVGNILSKLGLRSRVEIATRVAARGVDRKAAL